MSYINYSIDGNKVCATFHDFRNIQESYAGFGDSLKEAFSDLFNTAHKYPDLRELTSWEMKWVQAAGPLDTAGNKHPASRYRGYKGEPLNDNATAGQKEAWQEGKNARENP